MPVPSARPLALAWQIRNVVHSRSALLASSLKSQSLSTSGARSTAEAAAASKKDAAEKKSSASTSTSITSTTPKKKENSKGNQKPESREEIGGPKGPEPTRYNDWEKNGRVSDF